MRYSIFVSIIIAIILFASCNTEKRQSIRFDKLKSKCELSDNVKVRNIPPQKCLSWFPVKKDSFVSIRNIYSPGKAKIDTETIYIDTSKSNEHHKCSGYKIIRSHKVDTFYKESTTTINQESTARLSICENEKQALEREKQNLALERDKYKSKYQEIENKYTRLCKMIAWIALFLAIYFAWKFAKKKYFI